jgi:hypothetical protein
MELGALARQLVGEATRCDAAFPPRRRFLMTRATGEEPGIADPGVLDTPSASARGA